MVLNRNSPTARLFRWFYDEDTMPDNLCSYFWKVLWAWILVVPICIFCFPFFFIRNTDAFKDGSHIAVKVVISMLMYIGALLLFSMVLGVSRLFITFNGELLKIANIGLIALAVIIVVLSFNWIFGDEDENIIKRFIDAKIGKYCPKIDWEEKEAKS